jgi:subtilase family serine protease
VAARPAEGAYGLRPQDLRSAYFPGEAPDAPVSEPQTIALVDAYDDLDAEADLKTYDQEFGLPECTAANGCFQQVNQNGEAGNLPFPGSEQGRLQAQWVCEGDTSASVCKELEGAGEWSRETSLDIEVAHAVCQNCHIVLVEADNEESAGLETAGTITPGSLGVGSLGVRRL